MLQEKALSDETTENLMSFTHTRIIQIPCREHCQYQGKRTSVSQLEKLQKIQSPVKTRPWILVTKVIFPHWRPHSSSRTRRFLNAKRTRWWELGQEEKQVAEDEMFRWHH